MNARNRLGAMRRRTKLAAIGIALFAAISLAACGVPEEEVEGSLTPEQADELKAGLDTIETDAEERNCDDAEAGASDLKQQIDDLPDDVGVETKTRLRSGADQLISNIESDCTEPETGDTSSDPSVDETTDTSSPAPVEEEPAPIPEEEPVPEEEEAPAPEEPAPEEEEEAPAPPDDSGPGNSENAPGNPDPPANGQGSDVEGAGSGGIAP